MVPYYLEAPIVAMIRHSRSCVCIRSADILARPMTGFGSNLSVIEVRPVLRRATARQVPGE
jgi:hypothetical protein